MKNLFLMLGVVTILTGASVALADETVSTDGGDIKSVKTVVINDLVRGEMSKTQGDLQKDFGSAKRKLAELAAQRKAALEDARELADKQRIGVETFKKYGTLLVVRYGNEKGELESGAELTGKEVENINKLFQMYLSANPLHGRVSARYAQSTLDWGVARLRENLAVSSAPTELNNPELEIIARQAQEAEGAAKRFSDMASRLGVSLDQAAGYASGDSSGDRAPASDGSGAEEKRSKKKKKSDEQGEQKP